MCIYLIENGSNSIWLGPIEHNTISIQYSVKLKYLSFFHFLLGISMQYPKILNGETKKMVY